jgi:uncharacterized protein
MKAVRASLVALLLCWPFMAFASGSAFAQVAVPALTGRVVDQTGTLSSGEIASLTERLADLETRKGSQIAVLIVPTTRPEEIEQYSIRVAEAWKIGRKKVDDGALLVVAKNDHRLRIEVGYGLEGALTDVTSKRIIDEIITPKFRNGDFSGGISDGVDRMIRVINGEPLPAPPQRSQPSPDSSTNWFAFFNPTNPFVIIGVLFLGNAMRTLLGRLVGSAVAGGIVGFLAWYLIGSLIFAGISFAAVALFTMISDGFHSSTNYTRGRSGWVSGGSSSSSGGWSSGSSSSDSGSFSGGGGSFGGGGASGSW